MWTPSSLRGFLPDSDPIEVLPDRYAELDNIGSSLPQLIESKQIRSILNVLPHYEFNDLYSNEYNRAMLLYSYFASAYVHSIDEPLVKKIPASIAIPLCKLAAILERPPILSYDSYCLNNWKRIDSRGLIVLGNIKLLQNFVLHSDNLGGVDEDWFILVHVDIEARASQAMIAVLDLFSLQKFKLSEINFSGQLKKLYLSLLAMNATLDRMPEHCNPEIYFKRVRPYIFSFENIIYEGVFDNVPQSFRGETGAQSSIIPTLLAILGIKHKDSVLTQHLLDMRNYMPPNHRRFITMIEGTGENFLRQSLAKMNSKPLNVLYNNCLEQLIRFRKTHLQYAVDYISKRVDNPTGTGGTPYMKWLSELINETENYFLTV